MSVSEPSGVRLKATAEKKNAEESLLQIKYRKALEALDRDEPAEALAWLAAVLRQQPHHRTAGALISSTLSHYSFPLPIGRPFSVGKGTDHLLLSPMGQLLTWGYREKGQLWDVTTGQPIGPKLGIGARAHFSSDGKRVLMGETVHYQPKNNSSYPGGVSVWDTATGKQLAHLQPKDPLNRFAISQDGSHIATQENDGHVRVWDGNDYLVVRDAGKEETMGWDDQRDLAFSRDGKRLGGHKRLWNVEQGAEIPVDGLRDWYVGAFIPSRGAFLVTHSSGWLLMGIDGKPLLKPKKDLQDALLSFQVDPTGFRLAGWASGISAHLWSLDDGMLIGYPLAHKVHGTIRALSPEGGRTLSRTDDGSTHLWSLLSGDAVSQPLLRTDQTDQTWGPDGTLLAVLTNRRAVELFDISNGREWSVAVKMQSRFDHLRLHPSEDLALVDNGGEFRWLDLISQTAITSPLKIPSDSSAFSADGSKLAIGSFYEARVFNSRTGEALGPVGNFVGANSGVAFSPDEHLLAIANNRSPADQFLQIWDWRTGEVVRQLPGALAGGKGLRWSPDGNLIVAGSGDHYSIWNLAAGKEVRHGLSGVKTSDISPGWDRVACGTGSRVEVRSLPDGDPIPPSLQHEATVSVVRYSPNGNVLASGARDRTVRLWDATTGQPLTEPLRHSGSITHLAFSPDGERLASGTEDGDVRIWDVSSGQPLTVRFSEHGAVCGLEFTRDGLRLIAGRDRSMVRIYEVPPLPIPSPAWLGRIAESVGGLRIDERGVPTRQGLTDLRTVKFLLAAIAGDGFYERWIRWFFADRATRTVSAFSEMKMSEAMDRLREIGTIPALEEVFSRRPTDPALMTALAGLYAKEDDTELRSNAAYLRALAEWNRSSGTAARIVDAQQKTQAAHADDGGFLARDLTATARQIDLTLQYNVSLETLWNEPASPWNFIALPKGMQTFGGVLFDVRGAVVVNSTQLKTEGISMPERVEGISVHQKATRLNMLHAAHPASSNGTQIGKYVLRYEDGQTADLPIVYGEDIRDCGAQAEKGQVTTNAKDVWTVPGGNEGMRLFLRTYDNPRPDAEIATLDFVSANGSCGPFVVAITVEP